MAPTLTAPMAAAAKPAGKQQRGESIFDLAVSSHCIAATIYKHWHDALHQLKLSGDVVNASGTSIAEP